MAQQPGQQQSNPYGNQNTMAQQPSQPQTPWGQPSQSPHSMAQHPGQQQPMYPNQQAQVQHPGQQPQQPGPAALAQAAQRAQVNPHMQAEKPKPKEKAKGKEVDPDKPKLSTEPTKAQQDFLNAQRPGARRQEITQDGETGAITVIMTQGPSKTPQKPAPKPKAKGKMDEEKARRLAETRRVLEELAREEEAASQQNGSRTSAEDFLNSTMGAPVTIRSSQPQDTATPRQESMLQDRSGSSNVGAFSQYSVEVNLACSCKLAANEQMRIIGNVKAFGQWSEKMTAPMKLTDGNVWVTKIRLDFPVKAGRPQPIEYKYVTASDDVVKTWEGGDNRILTWSKDMPTISRRDVWESQ
jgi:hypothetical protein